MLNGPRDPPPYPPDPLRDHESWPEKFIYARARRGSWRTDFRGAFE